MALRSNDRIIVIEKINPKEKTPMIDPEVVAGKNKLHLFAEPNTLMWKFRYERGTVPPALRTKFTSFKAAKEFAEEYFLNKNIRIIEIKD